MKTKINLGGEPALTVNVIASMLALLVTFKWHGLTEANAAAIVAVLVAGGNVLTAFAVRPIAPPVFTAFVGAAVELVGTYGFTVPIDTVTAIDGVVVTVLALIFRNQVTPTSRTLAA